MRPSLSLCMIVKDEEAQLGRCLASAAGIVDELVVVDTGSTDGTVAIAESFGARVVLQPWDGSFSSARNVSLEQATGDWILVLDADERLAEPEALRAGLDQVDEGIEACVLPLVNYVGEQADEEAVTAPSIRLFRNRPAYRYSRALHEQIMLAILEVNPTAVTGFIDARIEHFGYLNAIVHDKGKIKRNLALAEEEVKRYPDDAFAWYNLGQEHFRLCQWDEAIRAYKKGFPYLTSLAIGFAPALVKHLCVCLLNLQRSDEMISICDDAAEAYDDFTDLWVLRGLALMQKQDYLGGIASFETALAKGEVNGSFFISDEGVGSYKSWWWIGACRQQLGEMEAAQEAYHESLRQAVARHRYVSQPLVGLLQVYGARRLRDIEALALLAEAVDLEDPRWRDAVVRALLQQGRLLAAERLLEHAFPVAAATRLVHGLCLLREGRAAEAEAAWQAIEPADPLRLQADWHRLLAAAIGGDLARAGALLEDVVAGRGEGEMIALYRALLAAWTGDEASPPEIETGQQMIQAHLASLLELMLQTEAHTLFERTLPALDWSGMPGVEQAALLGRLYHEAGLNEMACEALLLALEAGDRSLDTLRLLGLLCLRRGAYAEAEAMLGEVLHQQARQGIRLNGQNAALLGYLAALSAQGKEGEAEPLWHELIATGDPAAKAGVR